MTEKSKVRVILGYTLLGVSTLAWIVVPVVPFLGYELSQGAAIVTGLIVVGEATFLLSVLLLGKDIVRKLKQFVEKLKEGLRDTKKPHERDRTEND